MACASESTAPRLYDMTVETGMPHLEENLRYSTTHETRCLVPAHIETQFPILLHASLKGCRLEPKGREVDASTYLLVCEGGNGTTGNAVWQLGEHRITGTLRVKLGGKNMTFYQRVTVIPMGQCAAGSNR